MKTYEFAGLELRINIFNLLFNKTMLIAYVLVALAAVGIYEIFELRYFSTAANAHAAGLDPTNPGLKDAMKLAVFHTFFNLVGLILFSFLIPKLVTFPLIGRT